MSTSDLPQIFDLWPSLSDFASDAGVSYGAAKQMRRRGSIPVKYWAALIQGAQSRGFDLNEAKLVGAHGAEHHPHRMDCAS